MVYYLKVNRENTYVIPNLRHWIDTALLDEDAIIYILCDNKDLERKIVEEIKIDNGRVFFLESAFSSKELDLILSEVTMGNWKRIGCAHLTTFLHARDNGYKKFWNIDADDTFFCLDELRLKEALEIVESYCTSNGIVMANLDMWRTISEYRGDPVRHWSFGVTYTDNAIDWLELMKNHRNDSGYHDIPKLNYNIDWYFTYLATYTETAIKTFYFDNLKFIHYYNNFFDYPYRGGFYQFHDNELELPIIRYCFGMESMGCMDIADDVIRLDIGIKDSEGMAALLNNCCETELFAKEIDQIQTTDVAVGKRLQRYMEQNDCEHIVFYGTGEHFMRNYPMLRVALKPEYICDGNPEKWGKEIVDGIYCISPDELLNLDNIIVIVSVESVTRSFEIVKELEKRGIHKIDHLDNLKRSLLGIE